ncbi:MAG: carbohydrate binding domain-containing protein, partial [Bacteroidaceae bacterium]|nr:carbohydrate binding domain-containing protein [Bacteroidaceae bacterium]
MKKYFTFALAAVAAMMVSAQTEQLKTGDHFQYNGNGYTVIGENLIENPSFDNGLDGWLGGGGGALSNTTLNTSGGIDGGAFIVPTQNSGKGDNNSIGMAWPIEKGKTYVFSYYTKN